ncbi:MAG: ankyrin repeat domain-containing protein [Treponema sp.]|jgi:ankyrin repeat protein|nr:ankyrin repeat domain-containing protein [Treponema sp.]
MMNAKRSFLAGICLAFICSQIIAQSPNQNSDGNTRNSPPQQLIEAAGRGDVPQVQALLDQRVQINSKDTVTGHTPLMAAALNGHAEVVSLLIASKANVNAVDKDGDTALMAASAAGHLDIVELLIAAKANVNAKDKFGDTALLFAAANGKKDVAVRLIAGKANVNAADVYGETPLYIATARGYTDIVSILLAAKANPNAANIDKLTPLMIAASLGRTDLVTMLLDARANVDAVDVDNFTALMYAALEDQNDTAKLLLDANAKTDIGAKTIKVKGAIGQRLAREKTAATVSNVLNTLGGGGGAGGLLQMGLSSLAAKSGEDVGHTALIFAAWSGNNALVQMLLSKGDNVNKSSNLNMTPLYFAAAEGHASTVKLLLDSGARVKVEHKLSGETALLAGIRSGNLDTVKYLIQVGADVNDPDARGTTPLMAAAQTNTAILKAVLDAGTLANINRTSRDRSTALIFAAAAGKTDCARMLLDNGADAKLKTSRDETALVLAADGGNSALVSMLLSAGADANGKTKGGVTPLFAAMAAGAFRVRSGWSTDQNNLISLLDLVGAEKPADTALLDLLLTSGVDVNAKDDNGFTLLMLAAATNNTEGLNRLLAMNADAKIKAGNGDTALYFASFRGNAAMVNSLLAAGANVDEKTDNGVTPLMVAANVQVLDILLKAGADINAKNKYDATPLMYAAQRGNAELFNALLNAGQDIKAVSKYDIGVLGCAAWGGNESIVDTCLAAGLPLNSPKGISPLGSIAGRFDQANVLRTSRVNARSALATKIILTNLDLMTITGTMNLNLIQKFLDAGADVNGGSPSPFFCTVNSGNVEAAVRLLAAGADPEKKYLVTPLKMLEGMMKAGLPLNDGQMQIYAMLVSMEELKKSGAKLPYPHTPQRTGLLKDSA